MDPTSNLLNMTPNFIFDPWHTPLLMSCSNTHNLPFPIISHSLGTLDIYKYCSYPLYHLSLWSSTPLLPSFPSNGVKCPLWEASTDCSSLLHGPGVPENMLPWPSTHTDYKCVLHGTAIMCSLAYKCVLHGTVITCSLLLPLLGRELVVIYLSS